MTKISEPRKCYQHKRGSNQIIATRGNDSMATTILDAERLRSILDYNQSTGLFFWRSSLSNRRKAGSLAGSPSHGYTDIGIDGKSYKAHRLAWLYVHGCWPAQDIDHIDGNRSNNAIENLREVSNQKNSQNRHWVSTSKKTSQYLGVTWHKKLGCWMSQIKSSDGRNINLGLYDDEHHANAAYVHAKLIYHDDADICKTELPPKPIRRERRRGSSSTVGVSYDKARGRWCAKPRVNGKYKHIGYFDTEAEAAAAVQTNTSPAFPPVPQEAEQGMNGIETPTTTDNMPA